MVVKRWGWKHTKLLSLCLGKQRHSTKEVDRMESLNRTIEPMIIKEERGSNDFDPLQKLSTRPGLTFLLAREQAISVAGTATQGLLVHRLC